MAFKVGFGFDVHQLGEGEEFWLGGILLDHHKGAIGHSDADTASVATVARLESRGAFRYIIFVRF